MWDDGEAGQDEKPRRRNPESMNGGIELRIAEADVVLNIPTKGENL